MRQLWRILLIAWNCLGGRAPEHLSEGQTNMFVLDEKVAYNATIEIKTCNPT